MTKQVNVVPALEKGLDILEFIAQQERYTTPKEISEALGVPIATTYRILNYLSNRKYLQESPQGGAFGLGTQLLFLADTMHRQFDLAVVAAPVMQKLATKTGQTAQLGVLQEFGVMYVEQKLSTKPVNIVATLRTVIPVNVSASGKVLVANLPASEQAYFLQNAELAVQTENSIVDRAQFQHELDTVSAQGYALDHEEYARGIGCVAAPIRDYRHQVIAAMGITGAIADYLDETQRNLLIQFTEKAALEVSQQIGMTDSKA